MDTKWLKNSFIYLLIVVALIALFLVANISTNLAAYKPFWWVLAVALASGSLAAPKEGTR